MTFGQIKQTVKQSQNFLVGRLSRAKNFRTKCTNFFWDIYAPKVRKSLSQHTTESFQLRWAYSCLTIYLFCYYGVDEVRQCFSRTSTDCFFIYVCCYKLPNYQNTQFLLCLDSIAVSLSLFGWSKQIQFKSSPNRVSEGKIQIPILILR